MSKNKGGRPPLIDKYGDDIIKLVKSGASFKDACEYLGIHESTLYRWKQEGRTASRGKYKEFFDRIVRAEAESKIRKIGVVEKACIDDPKLALELLARKYPKEWGRKQQIDMTTEISGADGSDIDINVMIKKAEHEVSEQGYDTEDN